MNTQIEDLRKAAQDIMKERATQKVKKEKLLKIGLTDSDIYQLFFAERLAKKIARKETATQVQATESEPTPEQIAQREQDLFAEMLRQIFDRYTFGVEIECYNARPSDLVAKANARGLEMHHEGYNHKDNSRYYKLVSDGSIHGENPIECVSPILNGNNGGFDSLKVCCDSLNEIGAQVNRSTGLHVHVGGQINTIQYSNVFTNYYYLENVIDTFMSPSRRDNMYAKRMNGSINEEQLVRAYSYEDICSVMNSDRYYKVNCMSWRRHHTIEFRQHQGTTDYEKISNWARFCVKLVHWSDNNVLNAPVTSIDDIAFLTDEEKAYFKSRASQFTANAAQ